MAVYTQVTREQLEKFLWQFSHGALLTFHGITQGVENSNYRVETTRGQFILTLFEKRVKRQEIPFFLAVMEHMASKGIVCPKVMADKDGKKIHTLAGKDAVLISFLEGTCLEGAASKRACYAAGVMLASMHRSVYDFPLKRENDLGPQGWENIFNKIKDQMPNEHRDLADRELAFQRHNLWQDVPVGTIHADFFKDNVLFTQNAISGVLDFYFSCTDYFIYDVAITMTDWCFDNTFHQDNTNAFLFGYQSVRPLSMDEKQSLPFHLRGASLRFYLTRYFDAIHVDKKAKVNVKNPQKYANKLLFYQQFSLKKFNIF